MLTAATIKLIQTLDKKKYRQKYNLFVVEGNKILTEMPNSGFKIKAVYTTTPAELENTGLPLTSIEPDTLKKISFLQHPKDSLALVEMPSETTPPEGNLRLVLDGIQDPGNLGTLIRLADWFGIQTVVCSQDTVDVFNPKVIQATMGSFLRVNVLYQDLTEYLQQENFLNVGTDMAGENLYKTDFPPKMNLILGNEGSGIRPATEEFIAKTITIPRFGAHQSTESLNVSVAAAIILGQIYSGK